MILEVTKKNIEEIQNSFLSTEAVEKEFENNPFAKYLILKEKDQVVGYIYYSDIYDRIEINQFEIIEWERNHGLGDQLLKELIKKEEKDITLEVREDNLPAIHVYEKNGFQKNVIREGYYQGVNGILMERKK